MRSELDFAKKQGNIDFSPSKYIDPDSGYPTFVVNNRKKYRANDR